MTDTDFRWATVTSVGPLRVQIDGDTAPLPLAPDSLIDPGTLVVADRVRCEITLNRVIVHGKAGALFYSRPQVDALFATPNSRLTSLEALTTQGWQRAIAAGIASSGATATLNSTTGVATMPVGCTAVRLDGILAASAWEYEVVLDLGVQSGNATTQSAFMRMSEGGVPNSTLNYQVAGFYSQFDGTNGVYATNSGSAAPIGAVSGAASYVDFATTLRLRPFNVNGLGSRNWFFDIASFTNGSARGVRAGGFSPAATSAFDGLAFYFNNAFTGVAQGKIHLFKRAIA